MPKRIFDYFVLDCDCPDSCEEKKNWILGTIRHSFTMLCSIDGTTHCANGHRLKLKLAEEKIVERDGRITYIFNKKMFMSEMPDLICGTCGEKMYVAKCGVLHYISEMDIRCAEKTLKMRLRGIKRK